MRAPALFQKLQAFRFDEPGSALPFAARLARENRWSRDYADRVVDEYLRFVYLAATGRIPATPSIAVDQAWHLHLCYTRSYWEDLCRDILGRPLHHGPTRGGRAEGEKFVRWYEHTLAAYADEFGSAPPSDIWPPADRRFAPEAQPIAVPKRDYWLLEKRLVRRGMAALSVITATAAACVGAKGTDSQALTIIIGSIGVFLLWAIFRPSRKRRRRGRRDRGNHGGCGAACGGDAGAGCGSSGCGGGCGGGD